MRRLMADELILSFVPSGEQRIWRSMTRMKVQLTRDRVRLQNQIECLLEEMRIKLSIVVSNLLGALANGETDPKKLAPLGGERLQYNEEQLVNALTGRALPVHREMLALQLQRLQLIDEQMQRLNHMIAAAMKAHQDAAIRQATVPGCICVGRSRSDARRFDVPSVHLHLYSGYRTPGVKPVPTVTQTRHAKN